MRILSLITALGVAMATPLFQSYNGVIDGNACTALTPPLTTTTTFQAPANAITTGNIGIHQLIFQAVADHYDYAGPAITINGIAGTYNRQCCTVTGCDAEAHATNPFSECGLTWCGGVENQWQYVDFTGTSIATTGVPQNSTVMISFIGGVPVALTGGDSGDPVVAISYAFVAPSPTPSSSVTPISSETPTQSVISSITTSQTSTQSPPSSPTKSPTISPSGICYSVSTQYGSIISLSSGWILVATGINVTQAYGSGYISMGTFAGCSVIGATCKCSYTQGSTVAGCGSKRNSYITYSYGSTTGITYTNESPTCSYNFAGTIGIPPSGSRTLTQSPSLSRTVSATGTRSRSASPSSTMSFSETRSIPSSASESPSLSITPTPPGSQSPTSSMSATASPSTSLSVTTTQTASVQPSLSSSRTPSSSESATQSVQPSLSSSETPTPSQSRSSDASRSPSITVSSSETPTPSESSTKSPSTTSSQTTTGTRSSSRSQTSSETITVSASGSVISSLTASPLNSSSSTPLVYCIPYPSSTSSATETPSNSPRFLITPWPTNGSASPSTSPFFQMIPYPSVSPNQTIVEIPATTDTVGIAVGSVAIGAISFTVLLVSYQYFMPKRKTQDESAQVVVLEPDDEALTPIYVNPGDLEEIKQLLLLHRKPFAIRSKP